MSNVENVNWKIIFLVIASPTLVGRSNLCDCHTHCVRLWWYRDCFVVPPDVTSDGAPRNDIL